MVTKPKKSATKRAGAKRTGRAASGLSQAVSKVFHQPQWDTSCKDWRTRIVKRETLTPCQPLFPDQAEDALVNYFDKLSMVDLGSNGYDDYGDPTYPTFGEVSPPWVREFVGAVFGCYCDEEGHPLRGRRLMKEFFLLISKKNSKSTVAAGIMLTALMQNWRAEAEFIILSPTKEVADNSFKPMAAAIAADRELSAILKVQTHIRTITHMATNATIKVVAADSATVSGKKAVGVLIDELHEFGKIANASQIFNEATGGLMSRPEGFIIYLTTQSSEPPAGVFKEKLEYARKVRDGKIVNPKFYPILYEFPEAYLQKDTKLFLKPENFYITNPNLGYSVDEETLVDKIRQAEETSQKELQDVMAKHLNIEVGMNLRDDAWPGARVWLEVEKIPVSLDYLKEWSEVMVVGVDGGGLDDLYGLAAMGRHRVTKQWMSWEHAYVHRSVLDLRKDIAPRLLDFEQAGDLTFVDVYGEDTHKITLVIKGLQDTGLLYGVGFDPNALGSLLTELEDAGIREDQVFKCNTGYRLAGSILTAERRLAEGVIIHAHRPLTTWCVSNAKCEQKGNAVVITKQISGKAKIDPLMAFFNCVELMATNPPALYVDPSFDYMVMLG
ncbi:terminase large subunit [Stenotrophomonas phage Silvanus]|nr:terminase large subunit [Stenotrophomonas phage Silvanus]